MAPRILSSTVARVASTLVALTALVPASALRAQASAVSNPSLPPSADGAVPGLTVPERRVTATSTVARRAERAPVIDGRDDDAIWATTPVVDDFRMFVPKEDSTPRFRTEVRVAYDDHFFYAFVRAYDPHPDSIVPLLSRRDVRTNSDQLKIVIDSYHDRRSGYEFAVNPAGVKRDYSISNDHEEDGSWDGIWDAATRIDSLGWTAEYRIPLSQLRFSRSASHTFGFAVWRDVARLGERYAWPSYHPSKYGFVSQLGDVVGLDGIPTVRRLEISPYTVAKNQTRPIARDPVTGFESAWDATSSISGGADLKYGLTSNLTVDATINPDFGQVEADPAQVNLNVFELFQQERRPFFVEGNGIYRFDIDCNDGSCTGLFYSRRIGRSPQLGGLYGDRDTPATSTILGAAKLSGRLANGLSIGILDATTQRELGARELREVVSGADTAQVPGARQTVEPLTNYLVARLRQDLRGGKSGIGTMFTATNRALDRFTEQYLRSSAYTGGLDFRHRFGGDRFELAGYAAVSNVQGDTAAIARTQRSPVHFYQREGADLGYDPARTSLTGDAESVAFSKVDGGITRFNASWQRLSPGFEINDVGYIQRADQQVVSAWTGLQLNQPRAFYRRGNVNFNAWQFWNTNGLRLNAGGNVNYWFELKNQWQTNAGIGTSQRFGSFNDRSGQGTAAIRRSPVINTWFGINGDQRWVAVPYAFINYGVGDYGNTSFFSISPGVDFRAGGRLSASVGPNYTHNQDDTQLYFFGNPGEFGHLDYHELGIGTRVNYTMTTNLSLQVYAQPFVASGDFSNLRKVGDPKAKDYRARYVPLMTNGQRAQGIDFTQKQLRMNTVLRWEYRPGSSLYLVWSQDRDQGYDSTIPASAGLDAAGSFQPRRNFDSLFGSHPKNTILVKASYWFSL